MDRRKSPRFEIGAEAILHSRRDNTPYSAVTVNISAGGLLLRATTPHPLQVGDEVVCEIASVDVPDLPFVSWGMGSVVRVDSSNAAIELKCGIFDAD